ncbi:hypothetical protein [Sulfurimonas sp.]|uniref:hypothetical protein n=1 Tax=Sulfurimonas sp. TaxID=2022749 RepID=UPI003D109F92
MKKLILSFILLSSLLFAKNPSVYAALGDVIYNNVDGIENLQNIDQFSVFKQKIQDYVAKVKTTKEQGFEIESGKTENKKEYLNSLRDLSKENDFFVRTANKFYNSSLRYENSTLFTQMVNSGLVDTKDKKQEIIDYYFAHTEDINTTGVIQEFLDEDAALKAQKEAELKNRKSKKERDLERIKQIREKDQQEQEALENKLQKELEEKKKQLRKEQKIELQKTR